MNPYDVHSIVYLLHIVIHINIIIVFTRYLDFIKYNLNTYLSLRPIYQFLAGVKYAVREILNKMS